MKFLKEFKEFAMRGNVLDMAIGIVIGAAFTGIVNSFVKDVLTPPLGLLSGNVDFSEKSIVLKEATDVATAVTLNYGLFINALINFIIVAFAIFILIKQINKLKRKEPEPEPAPTQKECIYCLSNIPLGATKCKFCASDVADSRIL